MKPSFLLKASIRLDHLFAAYKDKPALKTPSGTLSFSDVQDRLFTVMANLEKAGVKKRGHVAFHGENCELHLYLFLASWLMNFLYIPLDFKAPVATLMDNAAPDFMVTADAVRGSGEVSFIKPETLTAPPPSPDKNRSWPAIPFGREAAVIFTSGSTGRPRGIVHTVGNYVFSALGTNESLGIEPSDSWLLSLPLFHVGGVLIWVRTLLSGST
ncbi:MAG: AMP-binding protein, partial [Syntrophales bacterium]|nr:AMP-binding protein [Syntrophales bacterium]